MARLELIMANMTASENARIMNLLRVANFPDELYRRFKANAAIEGITMQKAAVAAITGWCDEREAARAAAGEAGR